jgi:flavin-dependent dehydrogenase
MRTVDVIVVGGGPAGSTAAWRLKRAGVDVLVLDRERFPRLKLCAGWITPEVLRDLELDPATYPHRFLTFHPPVRVRRLAARARRGAGARAHGPADPPARRGL